MASGRSRAGTGFDVREEVINVLLADILTEMDLLSVPEAIRHTLQSRNRSLPDVTVADLHGVRVTLEGKVGTSAATLAALTRAAQRRVEQGLSPICLAVAYPDPLRRASSLRQLRSALTNAELRVRVFVESGALDWETTRVAGLGDILRRSYELLVSEDVVASAVDELDQAIEAASELLVLQPAVPERLRQRLGITEEITTAEQARRVTRIAALCVTNAMIFQQVLAAREASVPPLARTLDQADVVGRLLCAWDSILTIDYVPIFALARDIVADLEGIPGIDSPLRILARPAVSITAKRAALRHDLMGRIYHRLLADAKYFGAFYTTVPAAALLLKLTLDSDNCPIDWSSLREIGNLKIADLACGTGTLLKATLQTAIDNYVRAVTSGGKVPDLMHAHQSLVEDSLWGFDVIPFAIHLAASALAIHEPDVPFRQMNLFTTVLDGRRSDPKEARLGSIDFALSRRLAVQADLLGPAIGARRATALGDRTGVVELPDLDLCVMNPPFTRSVGDNLLFGNAPPRHRSRMQSQLKGIVREARLSAEITVGLGSVFVAIADKYVKAGGLMSLVLPKGLLAGVSWKPTRAMLGGNYGVRYIVVSHEPGGWNFSESSAISECLIVARKLSGANDDSPTKVVNLIIRPRSAIEGMALARQIRSSPGARIDATVGTDELYLGGRKVGEVVLVPRADIERGRWSDAANFAQTDLARVAYFLLRGELLSLSSRKCQPLRLTTLGSLGSIGPDRRDIHDGFSVSGGRTPFPALWSHKSDSIRTILQVPNEYLAPLARAKPGRHLRAASMLWQRSGRLLIAERLRLDSSRLVAALCDAPVLSNVWWPFNATRGDVPRQIEKVLAVWLNSTLGILSVMASRVETEGAWIALKKPILEAMPVIDPSALPDGAFRHLLEIYTQFESSELLPIPHLAKDPTRVALDRAIATAVGIDDDLSALRQLLSNEPLFSEPPTDSGSRTNTEDDE